MKRILAILAMLIFMLPALVRGADYTSAQSGNWSTPATWGEADYPDPNDTATISNGHTVTVSANVGIGTGGAAGSDELTIEGTLTIDPNITLTVRGDTHIDGGTLNLGAGSSWLGDDGDYEFEYDATCTISLQGTSSNRCSFGADAGNYTWIDAADTSAVLNIDADYCDIGLGGGAVYGFEFEGNGNTQTITFNNCKLTLATRCDYAGSAFPPAVDSTFTFTDCDFRGLPSGYAFVFGNGSTDFAFTGDHGFWDCTFVGHNDGSTFFIRSGTSSTWVINNCVSKNMYYYFTSPVDIDYLAEYHSNGFEDIMRPYHTGGTTTLDNCAFYLAETHVFKVAGAGGTTNFTKVFSQVDTQSDNHYLASDADNQTVNILQCITKGGNAVICRTNYPGTTVTVNRLTHYCDSALHDAMYLVEDTEFTGSDTVRSCIIYATGANADALADGALVSGTTITACDYHAYHDVDPNDRYVDANTPGGDIGAHDVDADPQFVNGGADFASWDTSLGGGGTVANAFAEMLKLNGFDSAGTAAVFNSGYTVSALMTYLWAQYEPQNSALDGTGYDGVDIGAVDFTFGPSKQSKFHYIFHILGL